MKPQPPGIKRKIKPWPRIMNKKRSMAYQVFFFFPPTILGYESPPFRKESSKKGHIDNSIMACVKIPKIPRYNTNFK